MDADVVVVPERLRSALVRGTHLRFPSLSLARTYV